MDFSGAACLSHTVPSFVGGCQFHMSPLSLGDGLLAGSSPLLLTSLTSHFPVKALQQRTPLRGAKKWPSHKNDLVPSTPLLRHPSIKLGFACGVVGGFGSAEKIATPEEAVALAVVAAASTMTSSGAFPLTCRAMERMSLPRGIPGTTSVGMDAKSSGLLRSVTSNRGLRILNCSDLLKAGLYFCR